MKGHFSKIHKKFKQHPIYRYQNLCVLILLNVLRPLFCALTLGYIKTYTAHPHDMVHTPAKFLGNTEMRFRVTVTKTKYDRQTAFQYLPSCAFDVAGAKNSLAVNGGKKTLTNTFCEMLKLLVLEISHTGVHIYGGYKFNQGSNNIT